jgi:hypothetical protein
MYDIMPATMWIIEDESHAEHIGDFPTREEALNELRRLAALPWDQPPNVAPCMSWRTCGRRYGLLEYDSAATPWRELQREPMLEVSQAGASWLA